ncbi:hypothetical protein BC829DRAFT_423300, partial [Chytridium lagenaria]
MIPWTPPRVHILGAGAIGKPPISNPNSPPPQASSLRITSATSRVTLIHRHPPKTPTQTLTLHTPSQTTTTTFDTDTSPTNPIDVLLVTTKANTTLTALTPHLPRLHPSTVMVPIQNGLMAVMERVIRVLAPDDWDAGRDGDEVRHVGIGGCVFAPLRSGERVDGVLEMMKRLKGLNVEVLGTWEEMRGRVLMK